MDNNSYNEEDIAESKGNSRVGLIIVLVAVLIFLVAVGVIIPFVFAKNMVNDAIKQDTTQYNVSVTAVIAENIVRESDSSDGSDNKIDKVYTPVYEYEYKGKTYSVHGSVASGEKKYEEGEKVKILISDVNPGKMYDPEYNTTKVIKDFGSSFSKLFMLILIIPIVLLAVIAAVIVKIAVRASKKKKALQNNEENDYDPYDDQME